MQESCETTSTPTITGQQGGWGGEDEMTRAAKGRCKIRGDLLCVGGRIDV